MCALEGLADLRAQRLQIGGEGSIGAEDAFDGHRCSDVGDAGERAEIVEREAEHAEDAVGSVDEGKALLGAQGDGAEAGALECGGGGNHRAVGIPHLALADE